MNANLFHNILNLLIALLAGLTAFLLAAGCTAAVSGAIECSQSTLSAWINPAVTSGLAAAAGLLKTVINILRDGFGGLWLPQPPVDRS